MGGWGIGEGVGWEGERIRWGSGIPGLTHFGREGGASKGTDPVVDCRALALLLWRSHQSPCSG
jgi:hypothetical protein